MGLLWAFLEALALHVCHWPLTDWLMPHTKVQILIMGSSDDLQGSRGSFNGPAGNKRQGQDGEVYGNTDRIMSPAYR